MHETKRSNYNTMIEIYKNDRLTVEKPLSTTAMMKPHTKPHTLLFRAALCPNPLEENTHNLLEKGMG